MQCSATAQFSIGGVLLCRVHAGKEALAILLQQQVNKDPSQDKADE